jgi:hypothetical protein
LSGFGGENLMEVEWLVIVALPGVTDVSGAAYKSHSNASSVVKKKKPIVKRGPRGLPGRSEHVGRYAALGSSASAGGHDSARTN